MKKIKTKVATWLARIHGQQCPVCGRTTADYNKLSRYLETDREWRLLHEKRRDGWCFMCKNPKCSEYEKGWFIKD